jgi:hypothetical protein
VDDVMLTEVVSSYAIQMQSLANQLMNSYWSQANFMDINAKKTKEMAPSAGHHSHRCIERVTSSKLLGVAIFWDHHIGDICTKASKRLHFLKMHKRSATAPENLLH